MSLTGRAARLQRQGQPGEANLNAPRPPLSLTDGAYGLFLAGTAVTYLRLTRGYFFWADDWQLARRGHSLGDIFEPYNDHLTVVPIAIYRLLLEVFGFHTYAPERLLVIAGVAAVSVAMFILARARIGIPLAAMLAIWLLWAPGLELFPATFTYVALAATIVCATALASRGRRADITICIALTFALCTAGVGTAAAAGCLTHAIVTRSSLRRFTVIGIPSASWAFWWLARGRSSPAVRLLARPSVSEIARTTTDGIWRSVETLVLGNRVLAAVVVLLFFAQLLWRASQGARAAANSIAWTAALIFWWAGLAYNRGQLASFDAFRYEYAGAIIVVLAFMPAQPIASAAWSLRQPVAAFGVVALGLVIAFANHGDTYRVAEVQENFGRLTKQLLVVANVGPEAVPDDVQYNTINLGYISAGNYRGLVDEYGTPFGTDSVAPDVDIVRLGHIQPRPLARAQAFDCQPRAYVVSVPPKSRVIVRTGEQATRVDVRRFGSQFVPIGYVAPRSSAVVALPALYSKTRWTVMVERGCLVIR